MLNHFEPFRKTNQHLTGRIKGEAQNKARQDTIFLELFCALPSYSPSRQADKAETTFAHMQDGSYSLGGMHICR